MWRHPLLAVALILSGCGPSSPGIVSLDAGVGPDAAPACETGTRRCAGYETVEVCGIDGWQVENTCADDELCEGGVCESCPAIQFSVETKQSCALGLTGEVDAESFISVDGGNHRVLAMDRWGAGHILAWCDSSSFGDLLLNFDALGYAGQVESPRVLAYGDLEGCDPNTPPDCDCTGLPPTINYVGVDLPAQYRGDAAGLAADWDVIMLCGFHMPWTTDWSAEIEEFVSVHGKGFIGIGEYDTYVNDGDFGKMTELTAPAGILFERINLGWASTSTDVVFECVPDITID